MSLDFDLKESIECPHCQKLVKTNQTVFYSNITHNLTNMADKAGLYNALWYPDENGYVYAKDLVHVLTDGIVKLEENPDYFESFNSLNGWGTYAKFVSFVREVLNACIQHPNAYIEISR